MDYQSNVDTLQKPKLKTPKTFAVLLYNDDITTMDFVVMILVKIFYKTTAEASNIMMQVHKEGRGVAGIYTYDIALSKKQQADRIAQEKGFPLKLAVVEEKSHE